MSLQPRVVTPVPEPTSQVAHAAFPKGSPYLRLRDELGTVFRDDDFADLYPRRGQPALSPWRLALVTILQFREGLSDRQAADAVRARIDWKYLLGLDLTDPGFHFSVLSESRSRLLAGQAEERLLEKLLARCESLKLIKARGRQRTDATHVLASIRTMNRLELLAETLRAALNELAVAAPQWIRGVASADWYERYGRRIEDTRLPHKPEEREAYAATVGRDGFALLDRLAAPDATGGLSELPRSRVLRSAWDRHFERVGPPGVEADCLEARMRTEGDLPDSTEAIESPYDTAARYRSNRRGLHWTGYMAHLTETCDEEYPDLITHAETTTAAVHEVNRTEPIQRALVDAGRPPGEHLVDAGYVSAELLVSSRDDHAIRLVGPPRKDASWQNRTEGAYGTERFAIDWERKEVRCPEGRVSATWKEYPEAGGGPYVSVWFRTSDCRSCPARELGTRSAKPGRNLKQPTQPLSEALREMRGFVDSEEGRRLYGRRAGIEGTISQGVRSLGLRRARYRNLEKAHLQHVATASAINVSRLSDWLVGRPRAATRKSRFAKLAA